MRGRGRGDRVRDHMPPDIPPPMEDPTLGNASGLGMWHFSFSLSELCFNCGHYRTYLFSLFLQISGWLVCVKCTDHNVVDDMNNMNTVEFVARLFIKVSMSSE